MSSQPRPPGDTRLGMLGERVSEGCLGSAGETSPLLVTRGAGAEATA